MSLISRVKKGAPFGNQNAAKNKSGGPDLDFPSLDGFMSSGSSGTAPMSFPSIFDVPTTSDAPWSLNPTSQDSKLDSTSDTKFPDLFSGSKLDDDVESKRKEVEAERAVRAESANKGVSALSKKERDVHDQFEELRGIGMEMSGTKGESKAEMAKAFSKNYPDVNPKDLVDAIFGEDSYINEGEFKVSHRGELSISAQEGTSVHGATAHEVVRDIGHPTDGGMGVAHHTFMRLHDSDKGGGALKKHFAEMIPMYGKMGVHKVTVDANLEGGVYAWGRYGFDAENPTQYHSVVKRMLDKMGKKLEGSLSPEAQKELKDVHALLDAEKDNPAIPSLLTGMELPHLNKAVASSKHGKQGAKSKFLSSALSDRVTWNGTLDLTNERQMKHLSKYIGVDLPVQPTRKSDYQILTLPRNPMPKNLFKSSNTRTEFGPPSGQRGDSACTEGPDGKVSNSKLHEQMGQGVDRRELNLGLRKNLSSKWTTEKLDTYWPI